MRAALGLAMLAATAAAALLYLLPPVAGYQRYAIAGGSMEPSIPRGSMAYERTEPVSELRRGDVITYRRPGAAQPVTHRIQTVRRADGHAVVRTKGDANPDPDFLPVRLDASTQSVVRFHVPYAGFPLMALADPWTRRLALGLPALALVAMALGGLWREGGRLEPEAGS